MDNLNEMGLVPINANQLKRTNGGLILLQPKLVEAIYKSFAGAYQRGHDNAQNNCECQD
jgi:hypothetical protein